MSVRASVSVIVVNFNSRDLAARAVRAALSSTSVEEILVVDNRSTDQSFKRLRLEFGIDPRVRLLRNRRNLGFARACNIGMRAARGDYLLLLNPDCIVAPDTIARMVARMEQFPQAGLAGCTVRNPDGTEQAGSRRIIPTPWRSVVRVLHLNRLFPNHPRFNSFCRLREPPPVEPTYVEAISGAFMLVRREALTQVGALDKGYFLHCEDLDWCVRFPRSGWKILFVPDVEVHHYRGACSTDTPFAVLWHKHKGMIRFYKKFFRHQYPAPLMALVIPSVWVRFAALATAAAVRQARRVLAVRNRRARSSTGGDLAAVSHRPRF